MENSNRRWEEIWKLRYGRDVIARGGRVYIALPEGMSKAPDNRMPCPVCETNLVHFYRSVWANQNGREMAYLCECGAAFRVRHDSEGSWFHISSYPFKVAQ